MGRAGRGLRAYCVLGAVGTAAYFLLPQAAQDLALLASNLVAAVTVLVVGRRRRLAPRSGWLLLAVFPLLTGVGNADYFVDENVLHTSPFPSWGDAAFLSAYVACAAGLVRLQHARSRGLDLRAVLDGAVLTLGFAAASWVLFMAPLLDGSASTGVLVVALGYPVADVLVLAIGVRFLLTSHRPSPAFAWLAGTVLCMLAGDTAYAALNLAGAYSTGSPVDALMLAYNLGWGAVALHPRAGDLTLPAETAEPRLSALRLLALCAASVVPPAVLLAEVLSGRAQSLVVTAVASMVLFLLVTARMVLLVRQLEGVLASRRALQAELERHASSDDLTGLANRRRFTEVLRALLEARPGGGAAVVYVDLDRFKAVNDRLGHGAGDELLVAVARRLRAAVRAEDTVARLGGDEFAVVLASAATEEDVRAARERVLAEVQQPLAVAGALLDVRASAGAALAAAGEGLEPLLQRADEAMYRDKSRSAVAPR